MEEPLDRREEREEAKQGEEGRGGRKRETLITKY